MNENNTASIPTNENPAEPNTPTPEAAGGQGEKLFTQEDVNRIVSERLARERAKGVPDEREAALIEREKAVKAKESEYRCRDYLKEINIGENHHQDFLEVLDTSDFDKFKAAVDRLGKPYVVTVTVEGAPIAHPPMSYHGSSYDAIADAFKPKKRF